MSEKSNNDFMAHLEAAALHYSRTAREDATVEDFEALTEWLESSDDHVAAFNRVELTALHVADLPISSSAVRAESVTAKAIHRTIRKTPRWLEGLKEAVLGPVVGWASAAAAAVVAAFVMLSPADTVQPPTNADFASGNETRILSLSDGSIITLNRNSAVQVRYDEERRNVVLLDGEAMFDVAKNPARPFHVQAGQSNIRVVGTVFNVLMSGSLTEVSVSEGIVDVSDMENADSHRLTIGKRLTQRAGVGSHISTVDPAAIRGWLDGQLIYENESLERVVLDLQRYFDTDISLDSSKTLYFSGVLGTDDLDSVLELLQVSLGVDVSVEGNAIVLSAD